MQLGEAKTMKTFFRKLVKYAMGASGLLMCLYVAGQLFSSFTCTNRIVDSYDSPDHQVKAVVFQRECGATVGENSQVSIINALGFLPQEPGNVFIEDNGHLEHVSLKIELRWEGNRRLIVRHDGASRVFRANTKFFVVAWPLWQPVEIQYETF
jgi:hypothetical protein